MTEQLPLDFGGAPELADQQARDRARSETGTSFVVSAGAGAGKTETLIRRLEQALHDGCDPTRIVAITFTERAARDLVNKLRAKLPPALTPAIEQMTVGTIHSFCLSILRRHPLEAGLPPVFSTQDERLAGTDVIERAMRIRAAVFDEVERRDDPDLHDALDVLVSANAMYHFDALTRLIDQQWDRFEGAVLPEPGDWRAECGARLDRIVELGVDPTVPPTLAERIRALQPHLDGFAACRSMVDALAAAPTTAFGNTGGQAGKPVRDEVKQHVAELTATIHHAAVAGILAVLVPLVLDEAHARYQGGNVSFDDILVLTRRLLHRRPALCARLRTEIDHLCVDEFQDTDVVQYDIVQALTVPDPDPAGHTPVLFAVGDPKQSIYGFRAADVTLFEQLHQLPHLTPLQLSTNFRSRPAVLRWINAVFRSWFDADAHRGQVPFAPLVGHVDDAPATVTVIGGPIEATADRVSQLQARDIARTIAAAAGRWPCRDQSGAEHPARYADIAVLVRTRGELTHLEPALRRAGIPYVIEGGALLYDTREVRDLLRVLAAVNDTASPIKAVTALRTSVLAISDVELLAHRSAGGSWQLHRPPGPDTPAAGTERPGLPVVLAALAQLRRWSEMRHRVPVPELLAEIVSHQHSLAAAVSDGAHTTTWRRLRLVLDEARFWFEQTGGSVGEYLQWIAMRVDNDDRSNVTTDETDEDAVHVLTVHAAKGLEYPVVVAAGLGRGRPSGDSVRAQFRDDIGAGRTAVEVKFGRLATLGFTTADEGDAAMVEAARLAYVASTRARDHLVVCVHHGATQRHNSAAEMRPHLPEQAEPLEVTPVVPVPRPPVAELSDRVDRPAARAATWKVRSSWSATQLRHRTDDAATAVDPEPPTVLVDAEPPERPDTDDTAEPGPVRAEPASESVHAKSPRPFAALPEQIGRYGTRIGRAVHGAVQVADLHEPRRGLDGIVAVQCQAEEVPERFHRYVRSLVDSVVTGPVWSRMATAATSGTVRREMYVGAEVGGEGVYGIIDAVWMEDGRFVVVDVKTDHVLEPDAVLVERYRPQLQAYASALTAATGREVAETLLCVALPDGSPAATITVPLPG